MGLNYILTRKVSVNFNVNGSAAELTTDSQNASNTRRITTAAASVGSGYSSDQYAFSGFRWNWHAGGGMSANYSESKEEADTEETDTEKEDRSAVSASIGHSLARDWSVGRTSSINGTFSQSFSGSYNNDSQDSLGMGTALSTGWSGRSLNGSTFAGVTVSDSRTFSDSDPQNESNAQFFNFQLARNQNINRLSSMTGNINLQVGRQQRTDQDAQTNRSGSANMSYRHTRFLGVFALRYSSRLAYQLAFSPGQERSETTRWENHWTYAIGLLDTSLDVDFVKLQGGLRSSVRFRATRSF
jgi:hypothetical protein